MLIRCSECGGMLSDKAAACPHCGAPAELSVPKPSAPAKTGPPETETPPAQSPGLRGDRIVYPEEAEEEFPRPPAGPLLAEPPAGKKPGTVRRNPDVVEYPDESESSPFMPRPYPPPDFRRRTDVANGIVRFMRVIFFLIGVLILLFALFFLLLKFNAGGLSDALRNIANQEEPAEVSPARVAFKTSLGALLNALNATETPPEKKGKDNNGKPAEDPSGRSGALPVPAGEKEKDAVLEKTPRPELEIPERPPELPNITDNAGEKTGIPAGQNNDDIGK